MGLAFGVGDHLSLRVLLPELEQRLLAEGFVHDAASGPERQLTAALTAAGLGVGRPLALAAALRDGRTVI